MVLGEKGASQLELCAENSSYFLFLVFFFLFHCPTGEDNEDKVHYIFVILWSHSLVLVAMRMKMN